MQVERFRTASGLSVHGPLLLTPKVWGDERGLFFESWNKRALTALLAAEGQPPPGAFVQDNQSRSCRGVLRGLHYQLEPEPQAKLSRCIAGEIFDVAVDIRAASPTFGQWVGARLSAANHRQLWVPVGFAHGFLTLSDQAEVLYKVSGYWNKAAERSIRWDDPELAISWPLNPLDGSTPLLSEKDAAAPMLRTAWAAGELFA